MCNKIDPTTVERAVGFFDKRGDGNPQRFPILVAQCDCENVYWARVPNGIVWVEAEKEEQREPNLDEADEFARAVEGLNT